jgi:hypothetical protein
LYQAIDRMGEDEPYSAEEMTGGGNIFKIGQSAVHPAEREETDGGAGTGDQRQCTDRTVEPCRGRNPAWSVPTFRLTPGAGEPTTPPLPRNQRVRRRVTGGGNIFKIGQSAVHPAEREETDGGAGTGDQRQCTDRTVEPCRGRNPAWSVPTFRLTPGAGEPTTPPLPRNQFAPPSAGECAGE